MLSGILPAQNQYNIWYWGGDRDSVIGSQRSPGFDFNSSAPIVLTDSPMPYSEGTAVHCNSAGQLLFYSNADSVWDRNHNVMPNGRLGVGVGASSSHQSVLFLPSDIDTNIITMVINAGRPTGSPTGKMAYSIIDMSLNGGLGDVVGAPQQILTGNSEHMIGIKHQNGRDYWVVTHLYNSNVYYSFRFTPCGIRDTVISIIGPRSEILNCPMKANPQGDKIAYFIQEVTTHKRISLLYDFNGISGQLTNMEAIDTAAFCLGVSFSPDGSKLYYTDNAFGKKLVQFDMTAASIHNSKRIVGYPPASAANGFMNLYDIQIGRNAKLYISTLAHFADYDTMFVVNDPNLLGTACNFDSVGFSLAGREGGISLPNLITDYLNPLPIQDPDINFTFDTLTCSQLDSVGFSSLVTFPTVLDSNDYTLIWDFGDAASGAANIATGSQVAHQFSGTGSYLVTLTVTDGCRSFSRDTTILVQNSLAITIPDVTFCVGDSVMLDAGPGFSSYNWSTGETTQQIWTSTAGTFSVSVMDSFGCGGVDSLISSFSIPQLNLGPDTTYCPGDTIILNTGSGWSSILWSTGASQGTLPVMNPGIFYADVLDSIGCLASDTVVIDSCTLASAFGSPAHRFEMLVYPNPSKGVFQIDLGQTYLNISLKVYDHLGKLVLQQKHQMGRDLELNLSEMADASYLIVLQSELGNASMMVIKRER